VKQGEQLTYIVRVAHLATRADARALERKLRGKL
jgi:hypothetical protein